MDFQMGRFITPQGLKQLDAYQYKSGKYTWLDMALQGYWNYVVTLVPTWVAPNVLTLAGWLTLLSSTLAMLAYDFTFQEQIPAWCFFWAAASVWIYSTLDAIDGKQARRTQSSSALGQLFDHGCDSFCVSFMIINLATAAQLKDTYALILFLAGYSAFWIANWKEYNTGILLTNVGQVGVTEVQVAGILCFLLSGIFGQKMWAFSLLDVLPESVYNILSSFLPTGVFTIPFGGMLAYYIGIMIMMMTLYEVVRTLWQTRSLKSLKECFSLFVLMVCCCSWVNFSFFTKYIGIVLFSFGLLVALLVCKMIISSVTKMPLQTFYKQLVPLMLITLGMGILEIFKMQKGQPLLFWMFLLTVVFMAFRFVSAAIDQLSKHLRIYCFSLRKRHDPMNYIPEDHDSRPSTKKA